MPEYSTNGIDKNDFVRKIDKLEKYIIKAESRLVKHERELEALSEKEFGKQDNVTKSLIKLKLLGKKRSLR